MCKRATLGADPTATDYRCEYIGSRCKKSMSKGTPYPVCTIFHQSAQVAVCPKRFYEIDIAKDVLKNAWIGETPKSPELVREVTMKGFGNVDFVLADFTRKGEVKRFVSIELQAIDISGSVRPAYNALLAGETLPKRPAYGLNQDNVYKRYVTQVIRKGYFHHRWQSRIVAIIQDVVFDSICDRFKFLRSKDVSDPTMNVVFMS
ncbi:MAG: hypothetical protein EXR29_06910 [Betaproteobacteria bacterium]|nr:hypothetical protein [Betaproteobacteria bacterium]